MDPSKKRLNAAAADSAEDVFSEANSSRAKNVSETSLASQFLYVSVASTGCFEPLQACRSFQSFHDDRLCENPIRIASGEFCGSFGMLWSCDDSHDVAYVAQKHPETTPKRCAQQRSGTGQRQADAGFEQSLGFRVGKVVGS